MNTCKLYVGNLNYRTTSDMLKEMFSAAGNVISAMVITDKFSGRSKGFGFVEMENEAMANKAIEMFHDQETDGRKLVVNVARPLEERPPRREFGSRM